MPDYQNKPQGRIPHAFCPATCYHKCPQKFPEAVTMPMYPELMLIPMREELTRVGIKELRSAADVDSALVGQGTALVVVNSVCGCAAGRMRPAVRIALQHASLPEKLYSVFAGQEAAATHQARSHFPGYPPSSP